VGDDAIHLKRAKALPPESFGLPHVTFRTTLPNKTMSRDSCSGSWAKNMKANYLDRDNERSAPFALYRMPINIPNLQLWGISGYVPGAADWTSEAARNLLDFLRRTGLPTRPVTHLRAEHRRSGNKMTRWRGTDHGSG
jgi:hypothetical protein